MSTISRKVLEALDEDDFDKALKLAIVDHLVDLNESDDLGRTRLIKAVMAGDEDLVRLLAEYGADTERATKAGDTALKLASGEHANVRIVKILIGAGAKEGAAGAADIAAFKDNMAIYNLLKEKFTDEELESP